MQHHQEEMLNRNFQELCCNRGAKKWVAIRHSSANFFPQMEFQKDVFILNGSFEKDSNRKLMT